MHIHYYMHYLPGEGSAGSRQPMALASFLAERGHDVTVVSGNLNLDTGKPEPEVERQADSGGRLRVLRFPTPSGGRGSNFQRLWAYCRFAGTAWRRGRYLPRPDVVVGSVQPLFTGWVAYRVASRWEAPFILEVRDLWPDALVVKGAVPRPLALPLYALARRLYRKSIRIACLTPGIRTEILRKGIDPQKVDVFPNGFDPSLFNDSEKHRETVRAQFGWNDVFVALYAGSFTTVTAAEVFVRAAAALRHRKYIRFDLFGNGPTLEKVKALATELQTGNLHFHDPVPKVEIPKILAAADAALMALFESPLIHIYFENKFMDYLGAGKPILAAMGGEQARILKEYDAGRVVPAFDAEGLARLIVEVADHPEKGRQLGENGRRLVQERLLLPTILERYAAVLEAAAEGRVKELAPWSPL